MSKSNYKPGDKVLRKINRRYNYSKKKWDYQYGAGFKVHIAENGYLFDVHLNKFPEIDCVHEAEHNSPLWKALREDDE